MSGDKSSSKGRRSRKDHAPVRKSKSKENLSTEYRRNPSPGLNRVSVGDQPGTSGIKTTPKAPVKKELFPEKETVAVASPKKMSVGGKSGKSGKGKTKSLGQNALDDFNKAAAAYAESLKVNAPVSPYKRAIPADQDPKPARASRKRPGEKLPVAEDVVVTTCRPVSQSSTDSNASAMSVGSVYVEPRGPDYASPHFRKFRKAKSISEVSSSEDLLGPPGPTRLCDVIASDSDERMEFEISNYIFDVPEGADPSVVEDRLLGHIEEERAVDSLAEKIDTLDLEN